MAAPKRKHSYTKSTERYKQNNVTYLKSRKLSMSVSEISRLFYENKELYKGYLRFRVERNAMRKNIK